jgi:hypothetical protein
MPRPGDFPIGSVESRAAMRLQLKNQGDTRRRLEFVTNVCRPWRGEGPTPEGWNKEPRVGPWQDCGDVLMRMFYVPTGMAEGGSPEDSWNIDTDW